LIAEIVTSLLIRLNCSLRLIPAIGSIEASLFLLAANSLPAFCTLQQAPHWQGKATSFGLNLFIAIERANSLYILI
jgi:hypothetical protein